MTILITIMIAYLLRKDCIEYNRKLPSYLKIKNTKEAKHTCKMKKSISILQVQKG